MKKLVLHDTVGGKPNHEPARRPLRAALSGMALVAVIGCSGEEGSHGGDGGGDGGPRPDGGVCTTPGIGSVHYGPTEAYQMPNLGVVDNMRYSLTPIDCVDHITSQDGEFTHTSSGAMQIPKDDLTRGRLAIHRQVIKVFENEYDFLISPAFDAIQLRRFVTEPFAEGQTYNLPSSADATVWQVHAIDGTTETVAGKSVRRVTFEVMNPVGRTPEETQKTVYLVTDPADYMPVKNALEGTGAKVNYFALPARNPTPSTIENVEGRIWVDPANPSNLSVAYRSDFFAFDIANCSDCGLTLPYGTSGRDVTIVTSSVAAYPEGIARYSLGTYHFLPP